MPTSCTGTYWNPQHGNCHLWPPRQWWFICSGCLTAIGSNLFTSMCQAQEISIATACAFQKQSDAICFCWVKLKKAPLLSTRLWQPLVVAQKYSQYLNELLLKPTVSPPSTASEYSGMIDEELLLPRNVPYVPVEHIESLTVWHQFAKVTTLCQPWLRG